MENVPSVVGITLNEIHAHEGIHRQATETNQEKSTQQECKGSLIRILACIAEQQRSSNTSQQGESQADEMRLGLSLASIALGLPVGDLVGEETTKEPHKWRSHNDRKNHEAELVEVELQAKNNGRSVLLRSGQRADKDGVEGNDPGDVGEEGGLEGLGDGFPGEAPLGLDGEETKVVLVCAVTVLCVVQSWAVLAGADVVDLLASCHIVSIGLVLYRSFTK